MLVKQYKYDLHVDNRGSLVEILRESQLPMPIKFIYTTVTHPNFVRAGHYHKEKWEWFFVTNGKARITLKDLQTNEEEVLILDERYPTVLEIKPMVMHTIEVIGEKDVHLTAISNKEFDANNQDTFVD